MRLGPQEYSKIRINRGEREQASLSGGLIQGLVLFPSLSLIPVKELFKKREIEHLCGLFLSPRTQRAFQQQ